MKLVRDVMTEKVIVARTSTSFKELAGMLQGHGISAVPILNESDRLVGIVSESDLLLKEAQRSRAPRRPFRWRRRRTDRVKARGRVAAEVMTIPAITIGPSAPVAQAARTMHDRNVKRLPVVDSDAQLLGIVSRSDLLKVFLRTDADLQRGVEGALFGDIRWTEPDSIHVKVEGGIVTMRGVVENRSQVGVLGGLAGTVDGVVGVDNRIGFKVDDMTEGLEHFTPWGAYIRR
jgi:CBS domain-containing protein